MRIVVSGAKAELYLDGKIRPALIVTNLKFGQKQRGGVGVWLEAGTIAYFRNLRVAPAPQQSDRISKAVMPLQCVTRINTSSYFQPGDVSMRRLKAVFRILLRYLHPVIVLAILLAGPLSILLLR